MSDDSQSPDARVASTSKSPSAIDDDEVKDLMDEDSSGSPKKTTNGVKSDNDIIDDEDDDDAGGLFGSGSEDEDAAPSKKRTLDDEELDSGDDADRRDRIDEDGEAEAYEQREVLTAKVTLSRHPLPTGSDGELYLLKNPNFLGIEPKAFTARSFQPPTTGHHGKMSAATFSAAQTSNTTMRWRRSPNDPSKIESNSRIIRWSDGSLTLQIGNNPMEQLELPAKSLAPPQRNPITPTPISGKGVKAPYDHKLDSHTYLASQQSSVGFVQITNHLTTSLNVQSASEETDDALLRLQENMALAMNKGGAGAGPTAITVTEDPENAKRKAEAAEREKARADKRRQNQEQRTRDRNAGIGRLGGRSYGGGLTVGGLEDELGGGRPKSKAGKKKPRRRNDEYSDDEDDYRRGKTREDEYDEDDDFVARSDEEIEVGGDDEEEELLDEDADGDDDEEAKPARSPKRPREDDDEGGGGNRRRRRVLDDDDED